MTSKLWGAFRWILISGVATYTLIEFSKYLGSLELAKEYSGLVVMIINALLFAIAKFVEGTDK
jgi:hypothetical protein